MSAVLSAHYKCIKMLTNRQDRITKYLKPYIGVNSTVFTAEGNVCLLITFDLFIICISCQSTG